MRDWMERRQWVNQFLQGFAWPEFASINVCQKLLDDERYGREKPFSQLGGNNHNRLTTDAVARMFHAIFTDRMVSPARSHQMARSDESRGGEGCESASGYRVGQQE